MILQESVQLSVNNQGNWTSAQEEWDGQAFWVCVETAGVYDVVVTEGVPHPTEDPCLDGCNEVFAS